MSDLLFDGKEVRVQTALAHQGDRLVVTFTSRADTPRKSGFGEGFFNKYKIPAIHFLSHRNHWWQVEEMHEALAAVQALDLSRFSSIATYGSSMGAYGALLFSGPLRANYAIGFSPQFAINGRDTPWQPVWARDTAGLTEIFRMEECATKVGRIVVLVDPLNTFDMQHIRALSRIRKLHRVPLPFARHSTAGYLLADGSLSQIVLGFIREDRSAAWARNKIRASRVDNLRYWAGMRLVQDGTRRGSKWLPKVEPQISRLLNDVLDGRRSESDMAFLSNAVSLECKRLAGTNPEEAISAGERFVAQFPDAAQGHAMLSTLFTQFGDVEKALLSAKRALRCNRKNAESRVLVASCLLRAGEVVEAEEQLVAALAYPGKSGKAWLVLASDALSKRINPEIWKQVAARGISLLPEHPLAIKLAQELSAPDA